MSQVENKSQSKNKLRIAPLKNQSAFDYVNKQGKKARGSFMLMVLSSAKYKEETDTSSPTINLGLKINKKLGKAVIRNKIRRRIKSMVRNLTNYAAEEKLSHKSIIIVPNKGVESFCYKELMDDLARLFIQLSNKI